MGKQARLKTLRKQIRKHASEMNAPKQAVAMTIMQNAKGTRRTSDTKQAAWYFMRGDKR